MFHVSYVLDENFQIQDFVCQPLLPEKEAVVMAEEAMAQKIVRSFWDFYGCLN